MRRLVPQDEPGSVADPRGPYADLVLGADVERPASDRPWIALGMVVGLDGSASVQGRSGGLGAAGDALAFRRLRDATDTILVGAATVRAEGYGPGTVDADRRAARLARGLGAHPRLVVVSGRADLHPEAPFLAQRPSEAPRPLIVLPNDLDDGGQARAAALEASGRCDVVRLGERQDGVGVVPVDALLALLVRVGCRAVLCEGGPTLAAALAAADVIDETFLTLAPLVVGGEAPRLLATPLAAAVRSPVVPPSRFRLLEVWEHEDELLLRHRRRR